MVSDWLVYIELLTEEIEHQLWGRDWKELGSKSREVEDYDTRTNPHLQHNGGNSKGALWWTRNRKK